MKTKSNNMDETQKIKFAVMASGRGTNFENIAKHVKEGKIAAELVLLVCDIAGAKVLDRAKQFGVPSTLIERKNFESKEAYEREILRQLRAAKVDFLVLAGYMKIVGPDILQAYHEKILNIHPALLPAFKGAHAIKDAFDAKATVTGVTVHFVDDQVDHGATILQEEVPISPTDTLETLEAKIHAVEYKLYPKAIDLFAHGKIRLTGGRVEIQ